jgi:hypothetical protein
VRGLFITTPSSADRIAYHYLAFGPVGHERVDHGRRAESSPRLRLEKNATLPDSATSRHYTHASGQLRPRVNHPAEGPELRIRTGADQATGVLGTLLASAATLESAVETVGSDAAGAAVVSTAGSAGCGAALVSTGDVVTGDTGAGVVAA